MAPRIYHPAGCDDCSAVSRAPRPEHWYISSYWYSPRTLAHEPEYRTPSQPQHISIQTTSYHARCTTSPSHRTTPHLTHQKYEPSYTTTMSHFHFLNKVQPEQVTKLNLGENTSCVLLKKRTISIEPSPLPILQPDGVLVKVMATDESTGCCS